MPLRRDAERQPRRSASSATVGLRGAYADADFVLADGAPLVLLSRLFGRALPERVAGSDLVPRLFDRGQAERPIRVFLLGARPEVSERAARMAEQRWPGVKVVGRDSPPLGFERNPSENSRILAAVAAARPDVLVVGLGAPKQELWVHRHRDAIEAKDRAVRGGDNRLHRRRETPGPGLDAPLGPGMDAPGRQRAEAALRPLRARRAGASRAWSSAKFGIPSPAVSRCNAQRRSRKPA